MDNVITPDFSNMTREELIAIVQNTNAKLEQIKASKPKAEPKPKTAEQIAKEEARAAFEAVTLDEPGSLVRTFQDADRYPQVDAITKMVRALPYDRVARIAADLAVEVGAVEGKDPFAVAAEALTRRARVKKSEGAAVDEAVTAAADAETPAE